MVPDLMLLKSLFKEIELKAVLNKFPIFPFLEVHYDNLLDEKRILEVNVITAKEIQALYDSQGKFNLLQFGFTYPYAVKQSAHAEILKMVSHLNQNCLIPGFSFDMTNEKISYRAAIPILTSTHLKASTLQAIFKTITQQIETFDLLFKKASRGELSYEELVRESREQLFENMREMSALTL